MSDGMMTKNHSTYVTEKFKKSGDKSRSRYTEIATGNLGTKLVISFHKVTG
jgi:hypothetical protein